MRGMAASSDARDTGPVVPVNVDSQSVFAPQQLKLSPRFASFILPGVGLCGLYRLSIPLGRLEPASSNNSMHPVIAEVWNKPILKAVALSSRVKCSTRVKTTRQSTSLVVFLYSYRSLLLVHGFQKRGGLLVFLPQALSCCPNDPRLTQICIE